MLIELAAGTDGLGKPLKQISWRALQSWLEPKKPTIARLELNTTYESLAWRRDGKRAGVSCSSPFTRLVSTLCPCVGEGKDYGSSASIVRAIARWTCLISPTVPPPGYTCLASAGSLGPVPDDHAGCGVGKGRRAQNTVLGKHVIVEERKEFRMQFAKIDEYELHKSKNMKM
ncbi:hypothetical protein PGTUg99_019990 [Puccinia graminis f. sp. tritici]|uniref:Uncharacterized protein n=1 Tax=Puccinia graminis f. sp. tritici TaxID=56615 RepID=A0A5B0NGY4_PUCGR|nr:hypothetical protein PGTUg99_019990 [Puccinia graminis f. sp. tritici]